MEIDIHRCNGITLLYSAPLNHCPDVALFSPTSRSSDGVDSKVRVSTGRGRVRYREFDGHAVVVRHYRRGGLVRYLSDDNYCFTGLHRTRMWREFALLLQLHSEGLPVPIPVAALIERRSVFCYRGDLATRKIPDAKTLAESLAIAPLPVQQWQAVGRVIQRFHHRGFFHADLNAGNIMLDSAGEVYLIDLDRGRLQSTGNMAIYKPNLQRLRRSLDSFAKKQFRFNYSGADWTELMCGYEERGS